jgi:hypothetical protein
VYKSIEIAGRILILKSYKLDKGVKGIYSNCKDGKHVLFIDIDNVNPRWLGDRIRETIKKFKLSDVHILITKPGSFHLICLDKFTKGEVIDIQSWFDNKLTLVYQSYGIKRGGWVLRTSEKHDRIVPRYFGTITSKFSNREQSSAHYKWIREYYDIPCTLKKPDKLTKLIIDEYPTIIKEVK